MFDKERCRALLRLILLGAALGLPQLGRADDEKKEPDKDNKEAAAAAPAPAPTPAPQEEKPTFKVKPYGRVELDVIYNNRGTNPLDPRQFNGYATAAGPERRSSSTFNPRFSTFGLAADLNKGDQKLHATVEFDFYSTDSANLITPRLRLAYVEYAKKKTRLTFGMDWLPVAQLLPDILDFSIMGYTGNLWQRIPQITVRQEIGEHVEVLGTVFRFERGFTLQPGPRNSFDDPVKAPYAGGRIAYQKWGRDGKGMVAFSAAGRSFKHPIGNVSVGSNLFAGEWVVPIAPSLRWSGKVAHGQALGDEFFRFGQALNGNKAIHTSSGWTQLGYYGIRRTSLSAGWGNDDPDNKDLIGISNNSLNYRRNQRVFVNTVYDLFESLKVGFEYQFLRTNWTNGDLFRGHQVMGTIFVGF